MITHCTVLCLTRPHTCSCTNMYPSVLFNTLSSFECFVLIGAGFGYRNTDRDYPLCPEGGEVRLWRARRSCSLCNGDVPGGRLAEEAHGRASRRFRV